MRKVFTFEQLKTRLEQASRYFYFIGVVFWSILILYLSFLVWLYFVPGSKIGNEKKLEAVALVSAGHSSGSAFLFDNKKGLALTAAHVVTGTNRVSLFFKKSNLNCDAEVLVRDDAHDIALLQVKKDFEAISPLTLGDSDALGEGDQVKVVGYPLGEWSITDGTITMKTGEILRTNATTNPGNSGGPLIDKDYTVMGIIIKGRIYKDEKGREQRAEGMHYAVPINLVKQTLKEKGVSLEEPKP